MHPSAQNRPFRISQQTHPSPDTPSIRPQASRTPAQLSLKPDFDGVLVQKGQCVALSGKFCYIGLSSCQGRPVHSPAAQTRCRKVGCRIGMA